MRLIDEAYVLVTGGAGFVGCNLADRLLSDGRRVVILDDLSRRGVRQNVRWLEARHGERVALRVADVRDSDAVRRAVAGAGQVFHFAAQVAVTTSLTDPLRDFRTNVGGTLNVLEAARRRDEPPAIVFASTNKVYGNLGEVGVSAQGARYAPDAPDLAAHGVGEGAPLDFQSPYGCSKGAADQYVLDYARSFGLRACVFRMSCIYGPHQYGTEDQGWVAHFIISALTGRPITLYGDGKQVRDILYVDDLVELMPLAASAARGRPGRVYNVGGGEENAVSLIELLDLLEAELGVRIERRFSEWRPGDQRIYISDIARIERELNWKPRIGMKAGLRRLIAWIRANLSDVVPYRTGRLEKHLSG